MSQFEQINAVPSGIPVSQETQLEKIEAVIRTAKVLRASLLRQARLSEKPYSQKVSADQAWLGMAIEKERHQLHLAVVRADLGAPYPESYYGERVFRPTGFHEYRVVFERP